MSKSSTKKVTSVRASSFATFIGTFWAIIGLGIAIMYSLNGTIEYAQSTNSMLAGLAFGLTAGVVSMIVLPLIYFAFGWVIGYLQGWVFNVVVANSGGIIFDIEDV